MVNVPRRMAETFKETGWIDEALRYNRFYYPALKELLRALDTMDRVARQELTGRLMQRTFRWASRLPGALPAATPLEQRPIVTKSDLRSRPGDFMRWRLVRISAATSGSTGIPVRLRRSLRNIATEQAFIDGLLGVWGFSFKSARVARLRADMVVPIGQAAPPFGAYRKGGRTLLLSSNHLSPETASWFHDELARFRPDVLFTHPSSGEALARWLLQAGRTLDIPVVLTSSEMLSGSGRNMMEAAYRGTVVDYYGMAERVAYAHGLAAGAYFFNPAYGRVELLPILPGEAPTGFAAYEIVATGFWNDATPLVRYRTEDRVIVPDSYTPSDLEDVCLGLKPAIRIEGRDKEHLISPSGQVIVGLTHASAGIDGLVRMQIVQEAPDAATVRVMADPRASQIDIVGLIANLYEWAPRTIRFAVDAVHEVERLPSGKTPFIIRRF